MNVETLGCNYISKRMYHIRLIGLEFFSKLSNFPHSFIFFFIIFTDFIPTLIYIFPIYLICSFIYLHYFFFLFSSFLDIFFCNASFLFLFDLFSSTFSLTYRSFHLFISFTSIFFCFRCIFNKYLLLSC